nr:hypothetical protein [Candidatus Hydrogenedentota bacterium]
PDAFALVPPNTPVALWVSTGACPCCQGFDLFNWANLFLGVLLTVGLLIASIAFGVGDKTSIITDFNKE